MISRRNENRLVTSSIGDFELPVGEVGVKFGLPAQLAEVRKDRSARRSPIRCGLPTLARRFPTGICSMVLFERSDLPRNNTAIVI